jgi:putative transposase
VTEKRDKEEGAVLTKVLEIRIRQPKCGGKKIHRHISARYDGELDIGRDRLFRILGDNGLLVKKRKRYVKTTYSRHGFRKIKRLPGGMRFTYRI